MDILLLASPCQDSLTKWEQGLHGVVRLSRSVSEFGPLKESIVLVKPQILLLDHDLPGLDGRNGIAGLMRLSPETNIVVLGDALPNETEWGLFKAGVRGYCRNDIEPQHLKRVVVAIRQGELWIRRTLTCQMLDELNVASRKQPDAVLLELIENLTQREYEIAVRAGNGDTSKQIAESLAIAERTVKSHLSETYRKLGIAGRIELALLLAGNKHQSRRTASVRRQPIRVSSGGPL